MTTVAALITKLQTLPQDALVEVLKETTCQGGWNTTTESGFVDLEYGITVIDFTAEKYTSDPAYKHVAGKVFVRLEAE